MNLLIVSIFIGSLTVTSYRSIPSQTDDSPYYTSIGEHVHPHGVAVSHDLLKKWGGPLDYGDIIYIDHIGFKVVNDCMNERFVNRLDVWVDTYPQEKAFDKHFSAKKLQVWLISPSKETKYERKVKKFKR